MSAKAEARTARKPHLCEGCHWVASLRGVPTIMPGHRYLIHTTFPDGEYYNGTGPIEHKECIWCFAERAGEDPIVIGACGTFCCGDRVRALATAAEQAGTVLLPSQVLAALGESS